jgi:hypothetical protein
VHYFHANIILLICDKCYNSKFGIFELLVQKETFADAFLTGIVSLCSLQNSPLESSCVVVALIENYNTSKPLNVSPEKSLILSCDTVVANERYIYVFRMILPLKECFFIQRSANDFFSGSILCSVSGTN